MSKVIELHGFTQEEVGIFAGNHSKAGGEKWVIGTRAGVRYASK